MPLDLLAQHSGVVRTRLLQEHGHSRYRIDQAVRRGDLVRVRKGWIATADADPELVLAAQAGLMLSCITQAKRLHLWVRDSSQRHFAVPRPGSERRPGHAKLHYRAPVVPRPPFSLVDSIENVLALIVDCQRREDAIATWDSALNKGIVSRNRLARLPLSGRAREVLEATSPFADSGLESYVRVRLSWLRVPLIQQAWLLGHRVDFLIGARLVLQIDGAHHVGSQRTRDIRHDAELRLHGYTVIRVSYEQVMHDWPTVQQHIMEAIAQGLHLAA